MIDNPENGSRAGEGIAGRAKPDVPPVVTPDRPRHEGLSNNEDTAYRTGRDGGRSSNAWPEGVRRVPCLNCGRTFESDSKVQRLCRACR